MADLVMGAMGSLIPKLGELLKDEYSLQTDVKERISYLTLELELAQAALRKVALVPWDRLDEQVQIWARQVREASYDMEDVLDTFLVRVKGLDSAEQEKSLLMPLMRMANMFKKIKANRKISGDVQDIMTHLQEVTEQCHRYKVEDIVARPATVSTLDPRLAAMYTQVTKLVGMDKSSGELMSKLQLGDLSNKRMKTVSIVGIGGLGKTTLAKVVYDNLKGDFQSRAFVSVGRNPDLQKVMQMILIALDKERYKKFNFAVLQDITQFIDEIREFLQDNKRYFIVIDDLWDKRSWETIKLAIDNNKSCEGRIIITTRKWEIAREADEVYELPALPYDSSRKLFYTRIYGDERKYVDYQPDKISDEILRKCKGIPLAIITMASLLVDKQRDKWFELYKSVGFVSKDNNEAENTMRILSFSYYDMPSYLRTCLLYLSAFPEDTVIPKESLVWMWVAEGFVHQKKGISLFETGEGYFNDLMSRSMIQAVDSGYDSSNIIACRVHDMVLDFIRSMSREENFFTILENDQGALPQSNVRRLTNHNRAVGQIYQTDHFEMPKLRSFISLNCAIEIWDTLSSFKLLRVLAIENCNPTDGCPIYIEKLGQLLHLRFVSLRGTQIHSIPKEIGDLRFLQTLDLWESEIIELPLSSSLPKQLACLRISFDGHALDGKVLSLEGMTSLEELSLKVWKRDTLSWIVKDLGCLRELRVLTAHIFCDEEIQRDLLESLCHLHKLQKLTIFCEVIRAGKPRWQPTELVLYGGHLQHLAVDDIKFRKLPSCINPSSTPNLSHLGMWLQKADEEDLKILGRLPELRFLGLNLLFSTATIRNINDGDSCYFPKLRCCSLWNSVVLFVANKEEQSVSFHIWDGYDNISMPSVSDDDEMERPRPSVSDTELKDGLQNPMPSVPQRRNLQHGWAGLASYLPALVLQALAFIKRWSLNQMGHFPSISSANGTGEDPAGMPSVSDDGKKGKGSACSKDAAATSFMPSLQVLHFKVRGRAFNDHQRYCNNLGLEYLPSLREINTNLYGCNNNDLNKMVEAALRRAAQAHPNHPTLHIGRW